MTIHKINIAPQHLGTKAFCQYFLICMIYINVVFMQLKKYKVNQIDAII